MAKIFNPAEIASVKTNIALRPIKVEEANVSYLVRRNARRARRANRAI